MLDILFCFFCTSSFTWFNNSVTSLPMVKFWEFVASWNLTLSGWLLGVGRNALIPNSSDPAPGPDWSSWLVKWGAGGPVKRARLCGSWPKRGPVLTLHLAHANWTCLAALVGSTLGMCCWMCFCQLFVGSSRMWRRGQWNPAIVEREWRHVCWDGGHFHLRRCILLDDGLLCDCFSFFSYAKKKQVDLIQRIARFRREESPWWGRTCCNILQASSDCFNRSCVVFSALHSWKNQTQS